MASARLSWRHNCSSTIGNGFDNSGTNKLVACPCLGTERQWTLLLGHLPSFREPQNPHLYNGLALSQKITLHEARARISLSKSVAWSWQLRSNPRAGIVPRALVLLPAYRWFLQETFLYCCLTCCLCLVRKLGQKRVNGIALRKY